MFFFGAYAAIKIMVSNLETQKLQKQDIIAALLKKQTTLIAREQTLQGHARITQIAAQELGLVVETGKHPILVVSKDIIAQMEARNAYAR